MGFREQKMLKNRIVTVNGVVGQPSTGKQMAAEVLVFVRNDTQDKMVSVVLERADVAITIPFEQIEKFLK